MFTLKEIKKEYKHQRFYIKIPVSVSFYYEPKTYILDPMSKNDPANYNFNKIVSPDDEQRFHYVISAIIYSIYNTGEVDKIVRMMMGDKCTFDPDFKKYFSKLAVLAQENKGNDQVRKNLCELYRFFFTKEGGGNYLINKSRLSQEHNMCPNWHSLVQCCTNPDFVMENSPFEQFYIKEAERLYQKELESYKDFPL